MIPVVGTSGSGKTTAIEYLTRQLTSLGFRVGVAKHIHMEGFTIDTAGKDTWRHTHAGARVVIASSPNELAVIRKTSQEAKFKEIVRILADQDLDLALLEGFSTAMARGDETYTRLPKIVAAKNITNLRFTLKKNRGPILAITGPVANPKPALRGMTTPIIDIEKEGPLLTSIVRRTIRPDELRDQLHKASLKHGETCIGLAVGVRAAHVASSALASTHANRNQIVCGAKYCIAEALKTSIPRSRVLTSKSRNDRIEIKTWNGRFIIQLAPKRKFLTPEEALEAPDHLLFTSARFS